MCSLTKTGTVPPNRPSDRLETWAHVSISGNHRPQPVEGQRTGQLMPRSPMPSNGDHHAPWEAAGRPWQRDRVGGASQHPWAQGSLLGMAHGPVAATNMTAVPTRRPAMKGGPHRPRAPGSVTGRLPGGRHRRPWGLKRPLICRGLLRHLVLSTCFPFLKKEKNLGPFQIIAI